MPSGSGSASKQSAEWAGGEARGARLPARWLAAVRLDEVLVLQAGPLLGLFLGAARGGPPPVWRIVLFAAASAGLVAHVFVLNDWSETGEAWPERPGLSRREMRSLWIGLLVASLCLFAPLGARVLLLALAISALSAVYSTPFFHGKGVPVLSSVLHLCGGALHFLLGYAAAADLDLRAVAIGACVALTFTAGHLTQEVGDHDHDLRQGTRTNAVVFGKVRAFAAGLALFTLAFAVLFALALRGLLPGPLALVVALLYPVHVTWSVLALRSALTSEVVRAFRWRYRALFAFLGVAILTAVFRPG